MIDLIELLDECTDALSVPTWDYKNREEHLALIEAALVRDTTPDDIRKLLRSAAAIFREQHKMNRLSLALEDKAAGWKLAADIQSKTECTSSRFIYHGTIYGRLSDISKNGLVPGKVRVWKDRYVPRHLVDSAVFFASTWRGAMLWAESAHCHARGPRNGMYRSLVVIRLPASGFAPEPDPLANRPGCLMVKGRVSVKDAEALHGSVQGFPKWRPLADVLRAKR